MTDNEKRAMIVKAVHELVQAEIADSWKGGGHPEDMPEIEAECKRANEDFNAACDEAFSEKPIDMVLFCPACGMQHIDCDESPSDREWASQPADKREKQYWTNPPHRSHLCKAPNCRHIWRPADVTTNGVAAVKTKGKNDSPLDFPVRRSGIADPF